MKPVAMEPDILTSCAIFQCTECIYGSSFKLKYAFTNFLSLYVMTEEMLTRKSRDSKMWKVPTKATPFPGISGIKCFTPFNV